MSSLVASRASGGRLDRRLLGTTRAVDRDACGGLPEIPGRVDPFFVVASVMASGADDVEEMSND